jgi:hypothetical protein
MNNYVISKSPYLKEQLRNTGIEVPELGRRLFFKNDQGTFYLVNTVDVYKTCQALKNDNNRVFGFGGLDYLLDEKARIKSLKELPFEKDTYLVYISTPGATRTYTKFAGIADQLGLKNSVKVLGSEEAYLRIGGSIIASMTSGESVNQNLELGLTKPSIDEVISALRQKGYSATKLFQCKTVLFEYEGEGLKPLSLLLKMGDTL